MGGSGFLAPGCRETENPSFIIKLTVYWTERYFYVDIFHFFDSGEKIYQIPWTHPSKGPKIQFSCTHLSQLHQALFHLDWEVRFGAERASQCPLIRLDNYGSFGPNHPA